MHGKNIKGKHNGRTLVSYVAACEAFEENKISGYIP